MTRYGSHSRKGAVMVLMVIILPVLLILCACVVNLAYMELNRTEMTIAADASARAAGREFAISRDQFAARNRAEEFALLNDVANAPLQIDKTNDVVFGTSDRSGTDRFVFTPGGSVPNAVKVFARRTDASAGGSIPLLMPRLLGVDSFETETSAISSQVQLDISIVIDRSGSMAYSATEAAVDPAILPAAAPPGWAFCDPVPPNSRWLNVVDGVHVFLTKVANSPAHELVAMSTYAESPITNQPLTDDYASVINSLLPYSNSFCLGGTNIGSGLHEGAAALELSPKTRKGASKVVILLTDGKHNTGPDPVKEAGKIAKKGGQIFTITFSNEADQGKMKSVADSGGGKHFHATSPLELENVFREIADELPTLITE